VLSLEPRLKFPNTSFMSDRTSRILNAFAWRSCHEWVGESVKLVSYLLNFLTRDEKSCWSIKLQLYSEEGNQHSYSWWLLHQRSLVLAPEFPSPEASLVVVLVLCTLRSEFCEMSQTRQWRCWIVRKDARSQGDFSRAPSQILAFFDLPISRLS